MTEAEALYQAAVLDDLLFTYLQWWLSVSVGLLALGHFFAKRLNLFIVLLLVSSYVLFSLWGVSNIAYIVTQQAAIGEHLEVLLQSEDLTVVGQHALEDIYDVTWIEAFGLTIPVATLFLGTTFYFSYSYWRSRLPEDRAGAA